MRVYFQVPFSRLVSVAPVLPKGGQAAPVTGGGEPPPAVVSYFCARQSYIIISENVCPLSLARTIPVSAAPPKECFARHPYLLFSMFYVFPRVLLFRPAKCHFVNREKGFY